MRIITKYTIKEIIPNFIVALLFFSSVMVIIQIFKLVEMYVEDNVPLLDVGQLFIYTLPFILQKTIPVGVLGGTIFAISRLSGDSEIVAMRSNGISLLKIFLPVFAFGFVLSLLHLLFLEFVLPYGNEQYILTKIRITKTNPTTELTENKAYKHNNISIMADGINTDTKELEIVRITDTSRDGRILYAERGVFLEKDYVLDSYPLVLFNVSTYPYIQMFTSRSDEDKYRFEEKYNDQMVLYIEDTVDTVEAIRHVKIYSIRELRNLIKMWDANNAFKSLTSINEKVDLILRSDYLASAQNIIRRENPDIDFPESTFHFPNAPPFENMEQYLNQDSGLDEELRTQIEEAINNDRNSEAEEEDEGEPLLIERAYNNLNQKFNAYNDSALQRIDRTILTYQNPELTDQVKEYLYEFQYKFSMAFACLIFTLIAAPLGVFSQRSGKTGGLLMAIIIIIIWYSLDVVGRAMKSADPTLSAWIMNIVILVGAIVILVNRIRV